MMLSLRHAIAMPLLLALLLACGLTLAGCGENATHAPAPEQAPAPSPAAAERSDNDQEHDQQDESHDDSDHAGQGHHHAAPHGGALAPLGDHFAHIEIKSDPLTGEITLWVLDGEAERGIRISPPAIELRIMPGHQQDHPTTQPHADAPEAQDPEQQDDGGFTVTLAPVANVLTGETEMATSQFAGQSELLIGLERFDVVVPSLIVRGQTFRDVRFGYPQGLE